MTHFLHREWVFCFAGIPGPVANFPMWSGCATDQARYCLSECGDSSMSFHQSAPVTCILPWHDKLINSAVGDAFPDGVNVEENVVACNF